jgi:hypothetical protein
MRLYVPSLFNEQWHVEAWTLLSWRQAAVRPLEIAAFGTLWADSLTEESL